MTPIDDNVTGLRMLRMWDSGHNTADIAKVVGLSEPRVHRTIIYLRNRRRREHAEAEAATQARRDGKDAPATST